MTISSSLAALLDCRFRFRSSSPGLCKSLLSSLFVLRSFCPSLSVSVSLRVRPLLFSFFSFFHSSDLFGVFGPGSFRFSASFLFFPFLVALLRSSFFLSLLSTTAARLTRARAHVFILCLLFNKAGFRAGSGFAGAAAGLFRRSWAAAFGRVFRSLLFVILTAAILSSLCRYLVSHIVFFALCPLYIVLLSAAFGLFSVTLHMFRR